MRHGRRRIMVGRRSGLLVLACLLMLVSAVPVMADSTGPEPPSAPDPVLQASEFGMPSPEGIIAGHAATVREYEERERQLEEQPFVAERESSQHAYEEDTPLEAEELLRSTFGDTLEELNGEPSRLLSDTKLDENLGEGSAVITDEGEGEILEADQPIEVENDEGEMAKVDLTLEHTSEGFEPENPVTEVSIGATADEGVEVGEEGLTVTQVGAEGSPGRLLGNKNVFFGEVEEASDTDLMVSPTSHGVEFFDMLRSVDSPETLHFHVDLPEGDTLKQSPGGGAEILDPEGSVTGMVQKPHGEDAQGTEVPVELEVEGDSLALVTHHGEEDLAYPILIDPEVVETWEWWLPGMNMKGLGRWGWGGNTTKAHMLQTYETPWSSWQSGYFMGIENGRLEAGNWAGYELSAPNTNVYITQMMINPFQRSDGNCALVPDPYDFEGYWDVGRQAWNEIHFYDAIKKGYTHQTEPNSWGQIYEYGLMVDSPTEIGCWRELAAGGVSFQMGDWTPPTMLSATNLSSSSWVNGSSPFTIRVEATDAGLGVKEFAFAPDPTNPGNPVPKNVGCIGTYESPCFGAANDQFSFVGAEFPQGEDTLHVTALDPTLKRSEQSIPVTVKVDTEPPVLHIDGQLQAAIQEGEGQAGEHQGQGGPELNQPVYNLKVEATDGSTSSPKAKRSGVQRVEVLVDNVVKQTYTNVSCSASSCPIEKTYPLSLSGLNAGVHRLKVRAYDFAGNKPAELEREFEYFPATGLTEDDVTQRFPLPDGVEHGEGSYQGPELAVNVMNGNVVYHQRDVEVEGPTTNLEVELFYNSLLPQEESSEFGRGWTLSQTPSLEPAPSSNMATAVTSESQLTGNVALPQEVGKGQFSNKLDAYITKEPGGVYSVSEDGGSDSPATVYDGNGLATEVQTSPTASVEYEYQGEHLSEISVDDPGSTTLAPPPVKKAPSVVPNYVSSFGSAGTGNGQFSHPADVALDSKGNEWVADSRNNRVEEFTPGGEFVKSLGTSGTGNGQFVAPKSLAFDAAGNLWVDDSGNSRLEEFGPTGTFLKAVGTNGSGTGRFNQPEGMAIAPNGHILVSDTYNYRVVELNAAGEWIKILGPSGSGEIEPTGIDVSPEGKVWVADWSHNRVTELGESGEVIRRVGSEGSGEAQFRRPDAIAVGALGEVWVGDQNNERVQELTKEGKYVAQFGSAGSGSGQFSFSYPLGIATDNEGSLLVTDTNDNRVEHWQIPHFGYKPVYAATFGSTGSGTGQFRHPGGLAVDRQGNVWIPDVQNNRLEELNQKGEFVRQLGSAGSGNGQFSSPKSIAFTQEGEFWVADAGNGRLEEFTESGAFIRAIGSTGSGNGQFDGPEGIAIAPNGHIWVADTYNYRIVELDENGNFIKVVNPSGLGDIEPTGIAFGPGGNAWVADWAGDRVVEINPAGELIRSFGTSGTGNGQFERPDTVAIDNRGLVFVVDQNNGRVQIFNQTGEYLSQFGSAGSGAGQLAFGYPTGVAADARGNLWVADSDNNRVEKWQTGSWVPAEEETIPADDDPSVEVETSGGLITGVVGEEAGNHHYAHSGQLLTSDEGPEGTTRYEYEPTTQTIKKITLPNGTFATVSYDGFGRATEVIIDPAGSPGPEWTKFEYIQEISETAAENHKVPLGSREVIVEPQEGDRTFYAIDAAGDVLKSWNVEVAPVIFSENGTLTQASNEKQIDGNDTQELTIKAFAPEGVRTIQLVINGSTVVDEKTCNGSATECEYETMQWIVEPQDLPVGTMWIEVVITSRVLDASGQPRRSSTRWWVTVPYVPPPEPGAPQTPKYKRVLDFREEYGLDLDLNPVADELELHSRVWETIDAWWDPETVAGQVAQATWERWGVPLRFVDEQELEYRESYRAQDAPLIEAWAKEHAWNSYGGLYMDERAGGLLRVGFTDHQSDLIAQMKQELGAALSASTRVTGYVIPPTSTIAELEAKANALQEAWVSESAIGENIMGVAFDPETNKVRVEAEDVVVAEAEVSSVIGSLAGVEFLARHEERPEFLAGRFKTSGPVEAGDFVRTVTHGCTAAWGVTERAPPGRPTKKFIMTAGHCFKPSQGVGRSSHLVFGQSEFHRIGGVLRSALPLTPVKGETDAEIIETESESLAPTRRFLNHPIKPASSGQAFEEEYEAGARLCFSGIIDGVQCGKSNGAVVTVLAEGGVRSGRMLEIMVEGVEVEHGDSGAPVWNQHTGRPIGVLSGGLALGRPHGDIFVAPLRALPTSRGISQPGALRVLSQSNEPLWLNLP